MDPNQPADRSPQSSSLSSVLPTATPEQPQVQQVQQAPLQPQQPQQNPSAAIPQASSVVYAGIFQRWLALVIDGIILGVVTFLVGLGIQFGTPKEYANFVVFGINILISVAYYVFYQHSTGQTIGKKTMGVKVITLEGQTPSVGKFFLREYVGKILSAITIIGYPMAIFDSRKQALHDKLAGTFVNKV